MCLPPPAVGYQVYQHTVPAKAFPLPSTATIRGFPGPDSLLEGPCLPELNPGMVAFELMIQYFLTDQRCLYQPHFSSEWPVEEKVKQHFKITEALGLEILVTPALGETNLLLSWLKCERLPARDLALNGRSIHAECQAMLLGQQNSEYSTFNFQQPDR